MSLLIGAAAAAAGGGATAIAVEEADGGDSMDRYCLRCRARRMINASYSLPKRRRNSRHNTRQITPMQDPANMPREVMCHDLEMKPE